MMLSVVECLVTGAFMKLNQPFIRLPYAFDVAQLQSELYAMQPSNWMPHPSGLAGNSAIPLVSKEGHDNNDFDGHMQATPHLRQCEYIQQVMHSIDEVLGRSRLMRLEPGCEVSQHVDFNYHWYSRVRIHIPIVTDPAVMFLCGDEQVHMREGECWIFDSWRRHQVINASDVSRVHLVLDTSGSSRFWRTVKRMEVFANEYSHPDLIEQLRAIEYTPGDKPPIRTERYNSAVVMAPGEMEAMAMELIDDVRAYSQNDPVIVQEYEQLLIDLAKDWRQLWHTYGTEAEGKPHYQQLLNETVGRMRADPRVLVTSGNQIGIRPIIMQRIIRAALSDA